MYISEIRKIENFRNLSNTTMKFDKTINYLIGENNIGKTNILELLYIIFGVGKFSPSDFNDITKQINIELVVKYDNNEYDFVKNYFTVKSNNEFVLNINQNTPDDRITYNIGNSKKPVKFTNIKKLNVLYYYTQRMPSKEIDFSKSGDSAKALNYLIQHSLENLNITEKDVLNGTVLDDILKDINKNIDEINSVTNDDIATFLYPNIDGIICRLLGLGDKNNRDLSELGEGIQYAFNILLQIIETIHYVKNTRELKDFNNGLISVDDKKYFPLLLILDEPEAHQHSYRQRSLIKKICEIMQNENTSFISLLNELFGIDGIIGQIFIATHSPNILLNDYKQFIRIYRTIDNEIKVISGMDINIKDKLHKHMLRIFPSLKETMFSKCVLFVEGDTENGAFPVFAKRSNIDFDKKGIGLVKLDGADSVIPCMELFEKFGIRTFAYLDRDKRKKYSNKNNIVFTNGKNIEEDIYESFSLGDYIKYNCEIGKKNHVIGLLKRNNIAYVSDHNGIKLHNLSEKAQKELMKNIREKELSIMEKNKNALNGAIIAENVAVIPDSVKKILEELNKIY